MLEVQSFNNLLSASSSFNQMFANISTTPPAPSVLSSVSIDLNPTIPPVSNSSTTIIDLSSENDDDFEILATAAGRKRQHTVNENPNENKRNRQMRLYTDQKSVPLKKRDVGNSSHRRNENELSFLNLIGTGEDSSNQAQDLKVVCDGSKTASSLPKHRNHQKPEPKGNVNTSASASSSSSICNCFECFPSLGANSGVRPKCNKSNNRRDVPRSSAAAVDTKIDLSMIPGPSGLQNKKESATSSSMPVKKRNNYIESDDDYDSDDTSQRQDTEKKDTTLEAPHLQLSDDLWLSDLSDSSSNPGEIEIVDDDVIFISDRVEPIDLTAESDSENDARSNTVRLPLSIDDSVDRPNGDVPTRSNRVWSPINIDEPLSYLNPPTNNTSSSTRAPIMSSVALPASPQVVITMNPRRTTPVPQRTINFHDMITGNDVMLYDGVAAQNFSTQQSRPSVVNTAVEAQQNLSEQRYSNNLLEQPNNFRRTHNPHSNHQQQHHHHPPYVINSSATTIVSF